MKTLLRAESGVRYPEDPDVSVDFGDLGSESDQSKVINDCLITSRGDRGDFGPHRVGCCLNERYSSSRLSRN